MRLEAKPCPCGCKKFIVSPLFCCQEASLHKDEADELIKRWNGYEEARSLFQEILGGHSYSAGTRYVAAKTLRRVQAFMNTPLPHLDTCGLKNGSDRCTCGLLS